MTDMQMIGLSGSRGAGKIARVSDQDFIFLARYRWHLWEEHDRGSGQLRGPYAIAHVYENGHRTSVFMHTLIARRIAEETGQSVWQKTDHQNFDGLDNQRANLRDGTKGNTHNQRPREGGTSKYKGVSWHKPSQKWWVRITLEGKTRSFGLYHDEDEAAQAYNDAATELFGEYAHLNVIG